MVGIWHEITMMSSKINMLNQNKCFFMSLKGIKETPENTFRGSSAKLSRHRQVRNHGFVSVYPLGLPGFHGSEFAAVGGV
jgi:hypothetical protein